MTRKDARPGRVLRGWLRPPARHRRGFALLELLIGIAMLGLLATIVSGSMTFGRRVWERSAAISQGGQHLAGIGYLRRQIAQAMVIPSPDLDDGEQPSPFEGRPDEISFASFQPTGATGPDQPYMLSVSRLPDDTALTVAFQPMFGAGETKRPLRLLEGLQSIRFRYYGRMLDSDATRWRDVWSGQPRLPRIIEMTVTFAEGGQVESQTLSIRPRLE